MPPRLGHRFFRCASSPGCRRTMALFVVLPSAYLFVLHAVRIRPRDFSAKPNGPFNASASMKCSDVASRFPDSIPPLVHWTSKDGRVPAKLIPIVKSWKRLLQVSISNSTGGGFSPHQWHFMHWDDQQIRQLVSKHYPRLTPSYNKLVNGLERSDIGRLVVLHHIGGVYVDLDVELVRDPTPLLRPSRLGRVGLSPNFSCESAVWSQEPAAHPMFIFNMTSLISNAVILSRANHSFLSFVLNEWPPWFEQEWANKTKRLDTQAVFVTGPMMLQTFYNRYTTMRQRDRPADWCSDMLAKSDAFQPISDPYYGPKRMKSVCAKAAELSDTQQLYCKQLAGENFKEKQVPKSSYAVHKFMHLSYASRWKTAASSTFSSIFPIFSCKI